MSMGTFQLYGANQLNIYRAVRQALATSLPGRHTSPFTRDEMIGWEARFAVEHALQGVIAMCDVCRFPVADNFPMAGIISDHKKFVKMFGLVGPSEEILP